MSWQAAPFFYSMIAVTLKKRAWASLVGTLYYYYLFFLLTTVFADQCDCSTFLPLSRRDARFCVSLIASMHHFSKKKLSFFFKPFTPLYVEKL